MKNFWIFFLLALICFGIFFYFHQKDKEVVTTTMHSEQLEETKDVKKITWDLISLNEELALPFVEQNDKVLKRTAYTLSFNEMHEQAEWVAYTLSLSEISGKAKRKDNFKSDPDLESESAHINDYKRSGYDRGHLAPAADMSKNQKIMDESFFMSNMSPQAPGFNRGIWKELEEQVRDWLFTDTLLYVVSGPVLTDGLETIGDNQVSVPKYYYKIVADFSLPEVKAIAFLMPNEKSDASIYDYVVSIDSLESVTHLDFFYLLPDVLEGEIEQSTDWVNWE